MRPMLTAQHCKPIAVYKRPFEALEQASWLYRNNNDLEAFLAVTAIDEGNKQALIPRLMEAYRALPLEPHQQAAAELAVAILFRELGDLDSAVATSQYFLTWLQITSVVYYC